MGSRPLFSETVHWTVTLIRWDPPYRSDPPPTPLDIHTQTNTLTTSSIILGGCLRLSLWGGLSADSLQPVGDLASSVTSPQRAAAPPSQRGGKKSNIHHGNKRDYTKHPSACASHRPSLTPRPPGWIICSLFQPKTSSAAASEQWRRLCAGGLGKEWAVEKKKSRYENATGCRRQREFMTAGIVTVRWTSGQKKSREGIKC